MADFQGVNVPAEALIGGARVGTDMIRAMTETRQIIQDMRDRKEARKGWEQTNDELQRIQANMDTVQQSLQERLKAAKDKPEEQIAIRQEASDLAMTGYGKLQSVADKYMAQYAGNKHAMALGEAYSQGLGQKMHAFTQANTEVMKFYIDAYTQQQATAREQDTMATRERIAQARDDERERESMNRENAMFERMAQQEGAAEDRMHQRFEFERQRDQEKSGAKGALTDEQKLKAVHETERGANEDIMVAGADPKKRADLAEEAGVEPTVSNAVLKKALTQKRLADHLSMAGLGGDQGGAAQTKEPEKKPQPQNTLTPEQRRQNPAIQARAQEIIRGLRRQALAATDPKVKNELFRKIADFSDQMGIVSPYQAIVGAVSGAAKAVGSAVQGARVQALPPVEQTVGDADAFLKEVNQGGAQQVAK